MKIQLCTIHFVQIRYTCKSIKNCRSRLKHRLDDTLGFPLKRIMIHWFLLIRANVRCIGLEIPRTRSSRLHGTWSAEYCQDIRYSAVACSHFRFLLRRIWKYNYKKRYRWTYFKFLVISGFANDNSNVLSKTILLKSSLHTERPLCVVHQEIFPTSRSNMWRHPLLGSPPLLV